MRQCGSPMTARAPGSAPKPILSASGELARSGRMFGGCHATPAPAPAQRAVAAQARQGYSPPQQHPDARIRDAERELRKQERTQVMEVEKTAIWWESEHACNVSVAQNKYQLAKYLALATNANSRPLVMSFFIPSCPGCKRMFPKFMQIARENPEFDFIKVNTADLQDECQQLGANRLPFFKVWADGKCTHSFPCNLSTISELRRSLQDAASSTRPYTVFRTPSIIEMPLPSLRSPASRSSDGGRTAPAAGSFRQRTERMHSPSHGCDGVPAGAVRVSGSRLLSIDDLVSHRTSHRTSDENIQTPLEPTNTSQADSPSGSTDTPPSTTGQ